MTFAKRALKVGFKLNGAAFDGGTGEIDLTGYRCEVVVDNPGDQMSVSSMQMRIFGMSLSDMNTLSTNGRSVIAVREDQVVVSAGDEGEQTHQIFEGTIAAAFIDYAGAPEVALTVIARTGLVWQAKPAAANSYKGEADVATIIDGLAKAMGFSFKNNGVTTKLTNQYLSQTLMDQLRSVVEASGIVCNIENGTISIWPSGGYAGGGELHFSPTTGLVGYPSFTQNGVQVTVQFEPGVAVGRKVRLDTSVLKAQGDWFIQAARHNLSSQMPGGPWFTTCHLVQEGIYVPRV